MQWCKEGREVQQKHVSACVFHRHEELNKSEYLCTCEKLTDVLHILELPEKHNITDTLTRTAETGAAGRATTSSMTVVESAAQLSVHGAISMTASYADYTSRTRCHTVENLTIEQCISFWKRSVIFAAEFILSATNNAMRRSAVVVGVFMIRSDYSEFTVGIITQCATRDNRLQPILSQFCDHHMLTRVHAELPLCAAHRTTTMRLWWEPRTERVTPHRIMPPMKVILEQHQKLQCNGIPCCGYGAVNVFLCRPMTSRLCGTTKKTLQSTNPDAFEKILLSTVDKGQGKGLKDDADAAILNSDFLKDAAYSSAVQKRQKLKLDRRQNIVILHFDDLSVVEEGEHLIGVEVEALPSYRAFLPALYGHLAPFLVVAREDA
ncbi:uncharacterized protein TM35_000171200 [Trypanosoma theileri]|uniref:Uncharacterized protein n=1 Tax=Trypanosoma theileri TaxID=67003 RepID=A0A1X0NUN0_9TRYP|nr:uncharacterized protein TM35_000171200 [Trypanosoma theileri]ORC88248.1 hypothetical protein TM35_000171200 [Trypanosoma theileri]